MKKVANKSLAPQRKISLAPQNPIREFEITITARNNLLKARRIAAGLKPRELAEKIGISYAYYLDYECMRIDPLRRGKHDGEWRESILRIAKYWRVPPEILFPNAILKVTTPKAVQFFSEDELIGLSCSDYSQRLLFSNPEDTITDNELHETIAEILQTLTENEKQILKALYGIDCDELLPEEIAKIYDLTENQIEAIAARGLGKLRHPHVYNRIKYFTNWR